MEERLGLSPPLAGLAAVLEGVLPLEACQEPPILICWPLNSQIVDLLGLASADGGPALLHLRLPAQELLHILLVGRRGLQVPSARPSSKTEQNEAERKLDLFLTFQASNWALYSLYWRWSSASSGLPA